MTIFLILRHDIHEDIHRDNLWFVCLQFYKHSGQNVLFALVYKQRFSSNNCKRFAFYIIFCYM